MSGLLLDAGHTDTIRRGADLFHAMEMEDDSNVEEGRSKIPGDLQVLVFKSALKDSPVCTRI